MKKVFLIRPPYMFYDKNGILNEVPRIAPDMALLSLGTFLKQENIDVELIDMQIDYGIAMNKYDQDVIDSLLIQDLVKRKNEILWIGLSLFYSSYNGLDLASKIYTKLSDIPLFLGGYFPSSSYEVILKEYSFISGIIQGDGEKACASISHSIMKGIKTPNNNIPNLIWLNDGILIKNPFKSMPIDELTIMDFSLLKNPNSYNLINLLTSRGCPYKCGYCLERKMRPYSSFSNNWIRKQLQNLNEHMNAKNIFLHDPSFIINKLLLEEKISILEKSKFNFAIECRLDTVSPDCIEKLFRVGVKLIYFGFESASIDSLVRMKKVTCVEKAKKYLVNTQVILKKCFDLGITPVLGVMLSYPGDTIVDFDTTITFIHRIVKLYKDTSLNIQNKGGFLFSAQITRIEIGSDLCKEIDKNYKNVILENNHDSIGQRTVLASSEGITLDIANKYREKINLMSQESFTSLTIQRFNDYLSFPIKGFIKNNSDIIKNNGTIAYQDVLERESLVF